MKRIIRDRPRSPEEAEEDRRIRELIGQEKPEINARIRKRMAEIRRQRATSQGGASLGQRILIAREEKGMSQASVAEAAGISQGYLSQLEQDEREQSLSIAARLARALGLSLDELAAEKTV